MTFGQLLREFFTDDLLKIVLLLVALDFALGVAAALKTGTFRFSYIADYLRNDFGFKVVPWFIVYAGAELAGDVDIIIPGLDLSEVAGGVYATLVAAMIASILNSLNELREAPRQPQSLKLALTGDENLAPKG